MYEIIFWSAIFPLTSQIETRQSRSKSMPLAQRTPNSNVKSIVGKHFIILTAALLCCYLRWNDHFVLTLPIHCGWMRCLPRMTTTTICFYTIHIFFQNKVRVIPKAAGLLYLKHPECKTKSPFFVFVPRGSFMEEYLTAVCVDAVK